ncbi:hypothetical protein [Microvirga lenta]|uniref:hypothetical protein n=2 Tax=Microvirga TaxID=186650 RepID=UPI001CFFE8DB|nr:hypothetical protein [Microvirga lenta]MCB5176399.1 hypothetical protein [Microvirga lenta]
MTLNQRQARLWSSVKKTHLDSFWESLGSIKELTLGMEPTSRPHVSQNNWETNPMNRPVALRAFFIFTIIAAFAAMTGLASNVEIAEVLFLIGGSLSALMLFFAMSASAPAPVPVRVRRRR